MAINRLGYQALILALAAPAHGATYYLSPAGSDSSAGTTLAAAWKTFAFAIPKLRPGDSLLLADGQYGKANSGLAVISCTASGGNAVSGTQTAPITLRAVNERKAFIKGDGNGTPLRLGDCGWWIIEGLRVENADQGGLPHTYFDALRVGGSAHDIVIRRNLVGKPNRYYNSQAINITYGPKNILIEENEVYDFHRWGIICFPETTTHCVVRRNYVNPRDGRAGLPGDATGPLVALGAYCSRGGIYENNIVEGVRAAAGSPGGGGGIGSTGTSNRFYGNLARDLAVPGFFATHHNNQSYGENCIGNDALFENNVVADSDTTGLSLGTVAGAIVKNHTSLRAYHGLGANALYDRRVNSTTFPDHDHYPTVDVTNSLMVGNRYAGYIVTQENLFVRRRFDHSHGWNNPSGTWGSGTSGTNPDGSPVRLASPPAPPGDVDPRLGACMAWIPESSPMKQKGAGGSDIGANILYRYENGVLTNIPLWNPQTGAFPCGAVVAGVNDAPGRSCFDVHKRLNVNANGCLLPAGYGGSAPVASAAPGRPRGLRWR